MKSNTPNSENLKNYYIYPGQIGRGSYGVVKKAKDLRDNSQVAFKYISKKGRKEKELREIRNQNDILMKINHEYIIKLLEVIETDNDIIIVTEYAETDLGKVLQEKKRFPIEDVKKISRQIFQALNYLHQNNILHRDLKPQNILIIKGMVKICDFGFAKKLSASTAFVNSIKGTPLYIAPQILSNQRYNYKVDIWSFGIIIYELFDGKTPFHSTTFQQLQPKIKYASVKFSANFPNQLKQVINEMLQKQPYTRASWDYLKKHSFFAKIQPEPHDDINKKSLSALQMKSDEKHQPVQQQEGNLALSSKVLFRLGGQNSLEEIDEIDSQIQKGKICLKQLKTNEIFNGKLLSVLGTACVKQEQIPKQSIEKVCRILYNLLTKAKLTSPDDISRDITKDKKILYCLIKIAESQTEGRILAMEMMVIGFILKHNFNNESIDFQTEEDICGICIDQIKNPHHPDSFKNALTVLGILACQAILTLDHSRQFIVRVQEQKLLLSIAQSYSQQNAKIVLQCIERFIHPNFKGNTQGINHLNEVFRSMKQQTAKGLLQKGFISKQSPIALYKDKNTLESYAKIMYECLLVSKDVRDEFIKHDYWVQFASSKNLKIFCLAYDYLLNFQLLSHQIINNEYIHQPNDSRMMTIFLIAKAYYKLSQKKNSRKKWDPAQTILLQISQQCMSDEDIKIKASREIQGYLSYGNRLFDNILANTFYGIVNDFISENNEQLDIDVCLLIFQRLLSLDKEETLKISQKQAAKLIILGDKIPKLKKNEKFLSLFVALLKHLLKEKSIYRIHEKEEQSFNTKFLSSIFSFVNHFYSSDESNQRQIKLYGECEAGDLHNLLLQGQINNKTLSILLTFIIKLVRLKAQRKEDDSRILQFLGIKALLKLKPYLLSEDLQLLQQIIQSISILIKNNQQYKEQIQKLGIINYIPYYLKHDHEEIRSQTLTMIGNLSKHEDYFFPYYDKFRIFQVLKESLEKYDLTKKILKGVIYAIGNISFYTDRFHPDIKRLIPFLKEALNLGDDTFMSNVFSTFSNLLRHSNVYLGALEEHRVIERILEIVMQTNTRGLKLDYGLNLMKKILNYPQIFSKVPRERFKQVILVKKQQFPTNENVKRLEKML